MLKKPDEFWKSVVWSDESKFELHSRRRQYVWRTTDEALKGECIQETVKYSRKIDVWSCFSWFGLEKQVEIHGNLNADTFTDILRNNFMLSAHLMELGDSLLFQQDNDPKHTSKLANEFFLSNKINLMKWLSEFGLKSNRAFLG